MNLNRIEGGTAIFQPPLLAIVSAVLLFLVFLFAVREGRFASHRARLAATLSILIVAVLVWLGPGLFLAR